MKDIFGKEIVGYEEACYLKEVGFDDECTGYYYCGEYADRFWGGKVDNDEDRYECVGLRPLYRNSDSIYRAAAPTIRVAKLWYTKNKVTPFSGSKK